MRKGIFHYGVLVIGLVGLSACVSTSKTMHAYAPKPPKNIDASAINPAGLASIQPAVGYSDDLRVSNQQRQSCNFSSFHRRHTVGYELDESRHIAFKASPKVDVWNPSDTEVEFSLRFTKAIGGTAKKRPDCTYGSGFYGQVPFLVNDGVETSSIDMDGIKSFVEERRRP
jgi:hypothetical protein